MHIALLLAAGVALVPVAASAIPSDYENQLRRQITVADTLYRDRGYTRSMGPEMDGLGEGATDCYEIQLSEGVSYAVHGV
jgi:hypothetical protein